MSAPSISRAGDMSTIMASSWKPKSEGEVVWIPGHSTWLRESMESGRPLLAIGRNSGPSGRRACRAAADDLYNGLASLKKLAGLDASGVLPSQEELAEYLFTRGMRLESQQRDGKVFRNHFALVDLREFGLVLSISYGSGYKVDEDLDQPHDKWVARCVRDLPGPVAGVAANRVDRLTRSEEGSGPALKELRHLHRTQGAWLGAQSRVLDLGSDLTPVEIAFHVSAASRDARDFRKKQTDGKRHYTGEVMVDGKVPYGVGMPPPVGLMVYENFVTRRNVLAIDTPSNYPDPSTATGVPAVVDENGVLVDQVENVRFLLANWGRDGCSLEELWRELSARRLSSQKFRSGKGANAYYGGPMSPKLNGASLSDTVRGYLTFYRTGQLELKIGGEAHVISNVFPPDGRGWASEDDFRRIDRFEERRKSFSRQVRKGALAFSGLRVELNRKPARLVRREVQSQAVEWFVRPDETSLSASRGAHVPDNVFTASIVDAITAADGEPLQRFVPGLSGSGTALGSLLGSREGGLGLDDGASVRGDVPDDHNAQLATTIESLERRERHLTGLLCAVGADGAPMLVEQAQARVVEQLNATAVELAAARIELAELATLHAAQNVTSSIPGLLPSDLPCLLEALRDPHASDARAAVRRGIVEVSFTTEPVKRANLEGQWVRWHGWLVFDAGPQWGLGSELYCLPFEGEWLTGAVADVERRILATLARMRQGHGIRYLENSGLRGVRVELAADLGVSGRFWHAACDDPAILRIGMAMDFPPAEGEDPALVPTLAHVMSDPAIVEAFGGEEALATLVERMRTLPETHMWLFNRGRTAASVMADVISRELGNDVPALSTRQARSFRSGQWYTHLARWDFTDLVRPRVTPCTFCSARLALPMRIAMVTGFLCAAPQCRRDEAGVRWDHSYDRYVPHPDLFIEAGLELELPEDYTSDPRATKAKPQEDILITRRRRGVEDLTEDEIERILDEYVAGKLVGDLLREHSVRPKALYKLLRAYGVPTRRP